MTLILIRCEAEPKSRTAEMKQFYLHMSCFISSFYLKHKTCLLTLDFLNSGWFGSTDYIAHALHAHEYKLSTMKILFFLHWMRSSKSCLIKLFILLMMLSGFSWVTWYLDSRSRSMNPWRDDRSQVWVWHFILQFPWSQSQYTHHHPSDLFLILKASQCVCRGHQIAIDQQLFALI